MARFRPIIQNDAMQCGQACLAMVCTHHGHPITVSEIDSVCRFTREGLSLKGLSDGASALGLDSVCAADTRNNYEFNCEQKPQRSTTIDSVAF